MMERLSSSRVKTIMKSLRDNDTETFNQAVLTVGKSALRGRG